MTDQKSAIFGVADRESAIFEATGPFLLFDYLRVPYQVIDVPAEGSSAATSFLSSFSFLRSRARRSSVLYWPCLPLVERTPWLAAPCRFWVHDMPLHGRLVKDSVARQQLTMAGGGWHPSTPITTDNGEVVGSLWRDEAGNLLLPFDPAEVISNCWSERYQHIGKSDVTRWIRRGAVGSYYRVRPFLPRSVQIRLRQWFASVQGRSAFPRWPVEPTLHQFYDFLLGSLADLTGAPVPWIAAWPTGFTWALVLTHDVETQAGYEYVRVVCKLEEQSGFRSAWNFVPRRYDVDDALVDELTRRRFEVGLHGLYHDGRDLESSRMLARRLPAMRAYAARWNAAGFRSPATLRSWELMPRLGFDYDSSYPDTDPYEPQPGGCCTWWPFFNEDLVELPITVPQDHTVFIILGRQDASLWTEKIDHLRHEGGMALVVAHPDYLREDGLTDAYRAVLERYRDDDSAWRALPREVSDWWRRRAASSLHAHDGGWSVVGPAAGQAEIRFALPRDRGGLAARSGTRPGSGP